MTRIVRYLMPALFAATAITSLAYAQTAPATPPADAKTHGHRPSPETMQRFEDGRFAMIKGALKMTDAQLKLWQPVEDLLRARHAERRTGHGVTGGKQDSMAAAPSLADRFDQVSTRLSKRADEMKALAATFRPFYDSLSTEQKAVAGPLFADLDGQRSHGSRFASREHHGEHKGAQQQ